MNSKIATSQLNALRKYSAGMRLAAEEWDEPWKTLIATALSAQSRDEVTLIIASELFKKYPSVERLARAKYSDVLGVLKSLNYNRTKAKHIIACAKELVEKYDGKVPHDFNALVELPGVGRKTANVFLSEMGYSAIGVDTHLAYCAQRLGWTMNKNPKKIELDLQKLFPKRMWGKLNRALVRFGKTYTSRRVKNEVLDKIKKL